MKILIVKPSSLGDVMHGLRVAHVLKQQIAALEITWVAREVYVPIVSACAAIDHVITFYRKGGLSETWDLIWELRGMRYDYVLDMEGYARSGLMSWVCRSKHKVGRSDAREGATLFYNRLVPLPAGCRDKHPVEVLLEFCRVFGVEPNLLGHPSFRFAVEDLELGSIPQRGFHNVAIYDLRPRGHNPWGKQMELAERILRAHSDVNVILMGEKNSDMPERIPDERVFDYRGALNLVDVVNTLQNMDLVVSSAGQPIHIASALGTKVLGLFALLDPRRCGAFPKSEDRTIDLIAESGDLADLSLEQVFDAVERLLGL